MASKATLFFQVEEKYQKINMHILLCEKSSNTHPKISSYFYTESSPIQAKHSQFLQLFLLWFGDLKASHHFCYLSLNMLHFINVFPKV